LPVIVVSLASIVVTLHQPGPKIDLTPHRALGEMAAAEALKRVKAGGKIILIDRETKMFKNPATQAHLKSFARTLRKAGQTVTATNVIKADPLRAMNVPAGDFLALLRRTTNADVIVSFLGPPALSSEEASRLGSKGGQVIAFCPGNIPQQNSLPDLFQNGVLDAAIVDDMPGTTPAESVSAPGRSEGRYQVITSSNLSSLPAKQGRRL
jgi:hypothetical protein